MLLEMKCELSENDRQSALRMSKMIRDVTADFKAYYFSIVDQITHEQDARAEQEILTEHELKVMNLIGSKSLPKASGTMFMSNAQATPPIKTTPYHALFMHFDYTEFTQILISTKKTMQLQ